MTGDDWLAGFKGNDLLKGGKGADRFVFNTDLDKKANVDIVKGFKAKQGDKIVLVDDVFEAIGDKLSRKELAFGKKADDGNDYFIVKEGKKLDKLFYDADGKGGDKQVLFAKVDADATLKPKDLMVLDDFVI